MAAPTVNFFANITTNEYVPGSTQYTNACTGAESSSWVAITLSNTTLVFTGSGVQSGDPTGTRDPIIIPATGSVEAPKTFLDVNATTGGGMKQVPLAGTTAGRQNGGGKNAVFCVYFTGNTAGAPYLEYWDTDSLISTNYLCLGGGNPSNSYVRGAAPQGATGQIVAYTDTWSGIALAGGGEANRLKLYNGPVTSQQGSGTALYYNLKVTIPYTAQPFNESPVCVLRYTYN